MVDWDYFGSSNSQPPNAVDPVVAGISDINC